MNKIKAYIKSILWKLLDIQQLVDDHEKLKKDYNSYTSNNIRVHKDIYAAFNAAEKAYNLNSSEMKQLRASFKVGLDFHKHKTKSWAIISIDSNPEFLRYISFDAGPEQAKEIRDFLSKYQGSNIVMDIQKGKNKQEVLKEISNAIAAPVKPTPTDV